MDNKDIVNSQAFKIINKIIDDKILIMQNAIFFIRDILSRKSEFNEKIHTRIHEEGTVFVDLGVPNDYVQNIAYWSNEYKKAYEEITNLQKFKLHLINDYDFTHGDDSLQKEIFGEAK